jgi:hypothetical protein
MTVDEFLFINATRQKRNQVFFQVYFVIFTRFVSSFALMCPNINPIRENVVLPHSRCQEFVLSNAFPESSILISLGPRLCNCLKVHACATNLHPSFTATIPTLPTFIHFSRLKSKGGFPVLARSSSQLAANTRTKVIPFPPGTPIS